MHIPWIRRREVHIIFVCLVVYFPLLLGLLLPILKGDGV
jgi:hypothetical protein